MNMAHFLTSFNFASGTFELDSGGTVLYTQFRKNSERLDFTEQFAGQNFFDVIAGIDNVKDFQKLFRNFVYSKQFTDNFDFDCRYEGTTFPLKVMILRAQETVDSKTANILILDIRKNIVKQSNEQGV